MGKFRRAEKADLSNTNLVNALKKVGAVVMVTGMLLAPVTLTSCTSSKDKQAIVYALSTDCDKAASDIKNIVADNIDGKYYLGVKFEESQMKRLFKSDAEKYIAIYNVTKDEYYAFLSYSGKDDGRVWLSDNDWSMIRRITKEHNPIKVVNYDKEINIKQALDFVVKPGQEQKFYSDPITEKTEK